MTQVALLLSLVLPGAVFQFVSETQLGPARHHVTWSERILRAIVASLVFDSTYVMVAGPRLVTVFEGWDHMVRHHPREVALVFAATVILFPTVAALALAWWRNRGWAGRYSDTPTAWDHMFRLESHVYVRARLKDGTWAGGWFGRRSFVSTFPEPESLYLEHAYMMSGSGEFVGPLPGSAGMHLLRADIDFVELIQPAPQSDAEESKSDK
ncbi:DUF6338 family protein [Myceligenerans halotolerans]